MPDRTIIPIEPTKFNIYIRNTNQRQLAINSDTTNPFWQDYGWSSAQSTEYSGTWHDAWVDSIYPNYTNPLTSTSVQKKITTDFIKNFVQWVRDQKLLEKIKASGAINQQDEATWNIDMERDVATKLSDKIPGIPVSEVKHLGEGDFEIRVMRAEDATRAGINREGGADSVQMSWKVLEGSDSGSPDPDHSSMQKFISKKSHFTHSAGATHKAKYILIYFRWYNTSYPQYAGTWSGPVIKVIA